MLESCPASPPPPGILEPKPLERERDQQLEERQKRCGRSGVVIHRTMMLELLTEKLCTVRLLEQEACSIPCTGHSASGRLLVNFVRLLVKTPHEAFPCRETAAF